MAPRMKLDEATFCNGSVGADPLNGAKTAAVMNENHLDEIERMVATYFDSEEVAIEGVNLSVGQVTAIARWPEVQVVLDAANAKTRVDESSNWVLNKIMSGVDIYGVDIYGSRFGAILHRRTQQGVELQRELIRFLNAGVLVKGHSLPAETARAAMLVRTNTLMQGYSGIRWEILTVLEKLLNAHVTPKLPLRGTVTASGDLVPLSYIAGLLRYGSSEQR